MKKILDKIPPIFKNFYLLVFVGFLVWIFIFDKNDLITHFKLKSELNKLQNEKEFYSKKIKKVEKEHNELEDNNELLEKFAREKYLMKKPNEDIYIVEEEEEESE